MGRGRHRREGRHPPPGLVHRVVGTDSVAKCSRSGSFPAPSA